LHNAGQIAGNSNTSHPMDMSGTIDSSFNGEPNAPVNVQTPAEFPEFTVNVTGAGASGTLSWADGAWILAQDSFMIVDPFAIQINYAFGGVVGTLELAP
jgi:hypothetical protein